ncbi:MAG TPA: hypothetical protein VMN82_00615 [Thermoanaerobaculia bacterium]|nr:hypothetical protein [Thermoanaerobaculia bacterium]
MASTLLAALHVVVLTVGETDPAVLSAVRALGADTVVTFARPSAAASAAAAAAGLRYVPFLSMADVDALVADPEKLAALQAIPGIGGFNYHDEAVVEGYTPAEEQERAYGILKGLFPEAVVLYATRLDLVGLDAGYLDGYFRPDATDLVAPYFYPVGTTMLGVFGEGDEWEAVLTALLAPLAARTPAGKKVLPVLQAFAQQGYPVGPGFPDRQLEVYRRYWPDVDDLAAFWWGVPGGGLLTGLSGVPGLRSGIQRLFLGLPPKPEPRLVPAR